MTELYELNFREIQQVKSQVVLLTPGLCFVTPTLIQWFQIHSTVIVLLCYAGENIFKIKPNTLSNLIAEYISDDTCMFGACLIIYR